MGRTVRRRQNWCVKTPVAEAISLLRRLVALTVFPNEGTIGISTYAAKALGDVVYIELPTLDTEISAGDTIGAVESVKSASDIQSPLAGKVIATNDVLEAKPGTINEAPEGKGWIAKLEVGQEEVKGLMNGEEYRKFTEE